MANSTEIAVLILALHKEDHTEYTPAMYTLAQMGESVLPRLQIEVKRGSLRFQQNILNTLVLIGTSAVPVIIDIVQSGTPEMRRYATIALGKMQATSAVDALIESLQDTSWEVRRNTAWALGCIGARRAVMPLLPLLHDPKSNVRWCAVEALERLADSAAVLPLIEALKDKNEIVRQHVAAALGTLGDLQATDPLIRTLKDKSGFVRLSAAQALGKIGCTHAVFPLIDALKDSKHYVRWAAAEALGNIEDPILSPVLKTLVQETDEVRQNIEGYCKSLLKSRRTPQDVHTSAATLFLRLAERRSLLRESSVPDNTDELVRPLSTHETTPPEELLRPANQEPSTQEKWWKRFRFFHH